MSFIIKDDHVLDKYNQIWDKSKENLNIKFHSMPVYDEKYINVLGDEIPKEIMHYASIAYITIDSVMRMERKELSTVLFRRMQLQNAEDKDD